MLPLLFLGDALAAAAAMAALPIYQNKTQVTLRQEQYIPTYAFEQERRLD
jgi:hypothetical protein